MCKKRLQKLTNLLLLKTSSLSVYDPFKCCAINYFRFFFPTKIKKGHQLNVVQVVMHL